MPRETKRPQQADQDTEQLSELPELTPMQFDFVQAMLQGKSASDAYRHAYSVEGMSDPAIWVEASRTKAVPNVSLWLAQARLQGMANSVVTLETHVTELDSLKQEARQQGAYGAAIKAEELKGRANGLYVDRIKTETDSDLAGAIKTIAKQDQALALQLARLLGLPDSDIMGNDNPSGDADKPLTH